MWISPTLAAAADVGRAEKGEERNFFVLAAMPEDKHVERIREVRQVLRSENLTNEVAAHFWFPKIQSAPKNSVPWKYDFYRFFLVDIFPQEKLQKTFFFGTHCRGNVSHIIRCYRKCFLRQIPNLVKGKEGIPLFLSSPKQRSWEGKNCLLLLLPNGNVHCICGKRRGGGGEN